MFIIILDLTERRELFPSWVHTKQSDNKDYKGKIKNSVVKKDFLKKPQRKNSVVKEDFLKEPQRKNSVVKEDFLKEPQRKCLIRRSAVPETTE